MASRARGLVSPATLERVLLSMVGMESPARLHAKPAAMPSSVGFVRMPFTLFFSRAGREDAWAEPGPSSIRMTTAMML